MFVILRFFIRKYILPAEYQNPSLRARSLSCSVSEFNANIMESNSDTHMHKHTHNHTADGLNQVYQVRSYNNTIPTDRGSSKLVMVINVVQRLKRMMAQLINPWSSFVKGVSEMVIEEAQQVAATLFHNHQYHQRLVDTQLSHKTSKLRYAAKVETFSRLTCVNLCTFWKQMIKRKLQSYEMCNASIWNTFDVSKLKV